ncbi:MAG: hypothetical protein ACFFAH_05985 [Promethearchaeota archaeon]
MSGLSNEKMMQYIKIPRQIPAADRKKRLPYSFVKNPKRTPIIAMIQAIKIRKFRNSS